jgi:Zn-dependent peptidase ImmA (M78 family)/transcriptional regulator with XRE-family HTH domain
MHNPIRQTGTGMINGTRVRQAREVSGLTQSELAIATKVHQSTITYIEMGRFEPSDDLLERIASQTAFPLAFFQQGDPPAFPEGSLLFRARGSMTSSVRAQALRYGEIVFEMVERLSARLRVISPHLPHITDEPDDIVTAAHFTRNALGLSPDTPIPNLIHAAEKSGILIIAAPFERPDLDAFSAWAGSAVRKPVLILFGESPGDRLRYTVAYELGHLVLHQSLKGNWRDFDKEAHRFAAELLMPEVAMREEIVPPVTLSSIASIKPRWGVSIQALIHRARDLEIITDRQYRYLFEQVSIKGWRTKEPLPIPLERPRAVRKMAELLYSTRDGKRIDYQRLADDMCLSVFRVKQILHMHAGKPVSTTDSSTDGESENSGIIAFPRQLG